MFRFLTLLVIVPLAACVADPNRDADARAPDDARTDAQTDESPPPRQLAGVAKPLFVAPAPHPAVTLANLAQPQTTAIVKAALDEAVQGLLFTSESDYPFQVFVLPGAGRPHVSTTNIKKKVAAFYVQRPETMPLAQRSVETRTLAALFKYYVHSQDWWGDFEKQRAPQFKKLKAILDAQLSHVHVYRVGPKTPWGLSPDIDVFIEGTTAEGDVIVLWTVSIET